MSDLTSKPITVGGLEFLAGTRDLPYRESKAWAVNTKRGSSSSTAWRLQLTPPEEGSSYLIADLKRRVLEGGGNYNWPISGAQTQRGQTSQIRIIPPVDAAVQYLQLLRDEVQVPPEAQVSLLMPAIEDAKRRATYQDTLLKTFPRARILSEPEMVFEYFHLVRRSLDLDTERNVIVLVLDFGASTTDATIVFSNRDGLVTTGEVGIQRAKRLRPIPGSSQTVAGRWVDELLAKRLDLDLDVLEDEERMHDLELIEAAKIRAANSGEATVFGRGLSRVDLEGAAKALISELRPTLDQMRTRLWQQVTGTPYARKLAADLLVERQVRTEADAFNLIDHVLLAGGTSLLPGLRQEIAALLPGGVTFHAVDADFPVAAAVGALAHRLRRHTPRRLNLPKSRPRYDAEFEAGLDQVIELGIKSGPGNKLSSEEFHTLLRPGDPMAVTGGTKSEALVLQLRLDRNHKMRLLADNRIPRNRQGRKLQKVTPRTSTQVLDVEVSPSRTIRLQSRDIGSLERLFLDLNKLVPQTEETHKEHHTEPDEEYSTVDPASEVVIDFGMSKTVVVRPVGGRLMPEAIGQACAGREPIASLPDGEDRRHDVASAPVSEVAPAVPKVPGGGGSPKVQKRPDEEEPSIPSAVANVPSQAHKPEVVEQKDLFRWSQRSSPETFAEAFTTRTANLSQRTRSDLLYLLLALSVRSTVALAGPPGCGKSTLARLAAELLGLRTNETCFDVAVQAHWLDDAPLHRLLRRGSNDRHPLHGSRDNVADYLLLLDEFNLTRPEYYLASHFHAADAAEPTGPTWRAIATLNVDEASRPPSPKVLDRFYLIDMQAASWTATLADARLSDGAPLTLVSPPDNLGPLDDDNPIRKIALAIEQAVFDHSLRSDLIPSLRVRADAQAILALHESSHLGHLLPRDELIDRIVAGRILTRVSGVADEVKHLLDTLDKIIRDQLPLSQRRLRLYAKQLHVGFVSPWQ